MSLKERIVVVPPPGLMEKTMKRHEIVNTVISQFKRIATMAAITAVALGAGASLSMAGNPPAPTISGSVATTAVVGLAYTFTPTATNAAKFSVTGALPVWLTFDDITGTLSGTPTTVGTSDAMQISALNVSGSASLPLFTITVVATPPIAWRQIGTGPPYPNVSSLVLDPTNPQTVYVGDSGSNGHVLKSTAGGGSWSKIYFPDIPPYSRSLNALVIDPTSPQTLYAGTDYGIYKSTNGGGIWTAVNKGLPTNIPWINTLVIDPTAPLTIYAGTLDNGVYKSTDGGANWQAFNNNPAYTRCFSLAVDPTEPTTVYAGLSTPGSGGVFKYTSSSAVWTKVTNGLPIAVSYVLALAIAPTNPQTIYAGTIGPLNNGGVLRSIDGGTTWSIVASGPAIYAVYSLAVDPTNPLTIYAGISSPANGGVMTSGDGGKTWNNINNGIINPLSIRALAIDPSNPQTIYAGAQGGVYKTIPSQPPTISGAPATTATVGSVYSFTPSATDATSFSLVGTLPPWLTFDTKTGQLRGTPPAVGIVPDLIIGAGNANGLAWLPAFSITVNPLPPTISGTPVLTATVGVGYSFTPTATDPGKFSVTGNIPPGLTFDSSTGTLSGKPTSAGSYGAIIISVSNASGSASLPAFAITVQQKIYHVVMYVLPGTGHVSGSDVYEISVPSGGSIGPVTAEPSIYSHFVNWTEDTGLLTSTDNPLTVTNVTADMSIKANFSPLPPVRLESGFPLWYYSSLQAAYNGNVHLGQLAILSQTFTFKENLNLYADVQVTLSGGYATDYISQTGFTVLQGTVTVSQGSLVADRLIVQ
jgi:photosystem II stability/assembly factor-like uncharacterized protein